MRVGTWNLEGRWSAGHAAFMAQCACDIWLLSIVQDAFAPQTGETARSEPRGEGDDVSWSAVWSAAGLEAIEAISSGRGVRSGRRAARVQQRAAVAQRRALPRRRRRQRREHHPGGDRRRPRRARRRTGRDLGRRLESRALRAGERRHAPRPPRDPRARRRAGVADPDGANCPTAWPACSAPTTSPCPSAGRSQDTSRVIAQLRGRRLTDSDAYVVECEAVAATV